VKEDDKTLLFYVIRAENCGEWFLALLRLISDCHTMQPERIVLTQASDVCCSHLSQRTTNPTCSTTNKEK